MNGLQMKYFVLKPKGKDAFARASRRAMFAYAGTIIGENPELSREIWDWAQREKEAAADADEKPAPTHWRAPEQSP